MPPELSSCQIFICAMGYKHYSLKAIINTFFALGRMRFCHDLVILTALCKLGHTLLGMDGKRTHWRVTSLYVQIVSHYAVHLKLTHCDMSIIDHLAKTEMKQTIGSQRKEYHVRGGNWNDYNHLLWPPDL